MKEAYPDAPLLIGGNEAFLLRDAEANLSAPFGASSLQSRSRPPGCRQRTIEVAGLGFEVREIPGHSPARSFSSAIVRSRFCVRRRCSLRRLDRSDRPRGDLRQLLLGIRAKLLSLPDTTVVYPGHGPATTVGAEKRSNPFVDESSHVLRSRLNERLGNLRPASVFRQALSPRALCCEMARSRCRIEQNWRDAVAADDLVLLPGDFSMARITAICNLIWNGSNAYRARKSLHRAITTDGGTTSPRSDCSCASRSWPFKATQWLLMALSSAVRLGTPVILDTTAPASDPRADPEIQSLDRALVRADRNAKRR